jgi:hypothetical protein
LAAASVTQFGADPSGVADSTQAIRAAMASGEMKLYFPAGTYMVTESIDIIRSLEIQGAGKGITKIIFYGSGGSAFNSNAGGVVISELSLSSASGAVWAAGIHISQSRCEVRDVEISRFDSGIIAENSFDVKVLNVDMVLAGSASHLQDGLRLVGQCVNVQVASCRIEAVKRAVAVTHSTGPNAEGLKIVNTFLKGETGLFCASILSLHLSNSIVEGSLNAVDVWNTRGLLIENTRMTSVDGSAISLIDSPDCSVGGSYLESASGVAVVRLGGLTSLTRLYSNTVVSLSHSTDNYFLGPLTGLNSFKSNTSYKDVAGAISQGTTFNQSPSTSGNRIRDALPASVFSSGTPFTGPSVARHASINSSGDLELLLGRTADQWAASITLTLLREPGSLNLAHPISPDAAKQLVWRYEWSHDLSGWFPTGSTADGITVTFGEPVIRVSGVSYVAEVPVVAIGDRNLNRLFVRITTPTTSL